MKNVPNLLRAEGPVRSIRNHLLKRAVSGKVMQSLTGNIEDLRKLSYLMHTNVGNPGLQSFLNGLNHDINHEQGMAKLFTRIGRDVNPSAKQKMVENLIFNWGYIGQAV